MRKLCWAAFSFSAAVFLFHYLLPGKFILPLAAFICSKIYRKTKNPYIGGIIMALVACIVSVTNTLTLG